MLSIETIWNEKMSIGIEPIDDHHKTMVRLMLETKAEADGTRHSEDIRSILSALIGYSKYHFLSEERIMFEKRFPHLEEQRADHKWFINHILTKDVLLKEFIEQEKEE